MELLVINGHDYSRYIKAKGYSWTREDLDSEKTRRVKSGTLRRDKITSKRTVSYSMLDMPQPLAARLDDDLSGETFSVTYLDLHGKMTKTFYCSSFTAGQEEMDEHAALCDTIWSGGAFTIIEV